MGKYIETPGHTSGKASILIHEHGAERLDRVTPGEFEIQYGRGKAIICVVENPLFDAAALAYSKAEFLYFYTEIPNRPKTWLAMDWEKAHELAGLEAGST